MENARKTIRDIIEKNCIFIRTDFSSTFYSLFILQIQLQIGKNENIHAWKLNLINY